MAEQYSKEELKELILQLGQVVNFELADETEKRQTIEGLVSSAMRGRTGNLRDLATVALAGIAAIVTILVTQPELIRSPALLFVATCLILGAIIFVFICRIQIVGFIQEFFAVTAEFYGKKATAKRVLMANPENKDSQQAWRVSGGLELKPPKLGYLEHSDKIAGAALIAGVIFAVGSFFIG